MPQQPYDDSVSVANSQKLDRLMAWIEGDSQTQGLNERVRLLERIIFGKEGERGMLQEHKTLYRIRDWVLGFLCTSLGVILHIGMQALFKKP